MRRGIVVLLILIIVIIAILAVLAIVWIPSTKPKSMKLDNRNRDDGIDDIDVKMAELQSRLSKHNNEIRSRSSNNRGTSSREGRRGDRSRSPSPRRGYGCNKMNENECRRVIEARYRIPFPTIRPDWLRSPHTTKRGKRRSLELDGYNPMNSSLKFDDVSSTGLAFEYDGIQHYEPGHFGMTIEQFDRLVERDRSKDKQCKDLGITLIRIPYTVKFNKIESYMNSELDKYDEKRKSQSRRFCIIC